MKISSETPTLITGGASGLGLAVVEKFSAMGAKVAIFDMNDEEGHRVAELHGATFQKVDVSNPQSVSEGLEKIRGEIGQPWRMPADISNPSKSELPKEMRQRWSA